MRLRDHAYRRRVIKKRIVAQRNADVETRKVVNALVEHEDIEPAAAGELEHLLTGHAARDRKSPLRENGFQRPTHPFIATPDQSAFRRTGRCHGVACVREAPSKRGRCDADPFV